MSALMSPLWIQHLIPTYGLWVLFAVVMLESAGVSMPESMRVQRIISAS